MNHRSSTVPGYPGSAWRPIIIPAWFRGIFICKPFPADIKTGRPLAIPIGATSRGAEPAAAGSVRPGAGTRHGQLEFRHQPRQHRAQTLFRPVSRPPGFIHGHQRPFLGGALAATGIHSTAHGQPVPEDVSVLSCRAVAWTLYMTKCDGFRLDAVKHVPVEFFWRRNRHQTDDPTFAGYTGAIQAMYDYVHGYGSNVTGNGYVETDGNRNSLFNTEAPRNDAMIFGEYIPSALAAGDDLYDYLEFRNAPGESSALQPVEQCLQRRFVPRPAWMAAITFRPIRTAMATAISAWRKAVNLPHDQDDGSC